MKNFIFKSSQASDLHKISVQLNLLLNEQRSQRADLAFLKRKMVAIIEVPVGVKETTDDEEEFLAETSEE